MAKIEITKMCGLTVCMERPDKTEPGKRYPAILFLHGAGTRGNPKALPNCQILTPDCGAAARKGMDFLVFVPLVPGENEDWNLYMQNLCALCKTILTRDDVDPERLSLTGNSMGGYAAWELAMLHPEYFNCVAPLCGGGMAWNAKRLEHLPVWAFHGAADKTVSCRESEAMVEAVNKRGGNARLTLYEGVPHDCWTVTYSRRDLYEWMLTCRNGGNADYANEFNSAKDFG